MATRKGTDETKDASSEEARLQGRVDLEDVAGVPEDIQLMAYVIGRGDKLLGSGAVGSRGEYSIALKLEAGSADMTLLVAPQADLEIVLKSAVYQVAISRAEFGEKPPFALRKNLYIPKVIWFPWHPTTVCVAGRVRKITPQGSCPVPFVKVEIFDVDREACWWPPLVKWWDQLIDKAVVNAVDLLREPPFPPVGPGPVERFQDFGSKVALNPQPLPPGEVVMLNPQPLPPHESRPFALESQTLLTNTCCPAGFDPQPQPLMMQKFQTTASQAQISALSDLVISSKIAPWFIFPNCFYSKALVCETTTDCDGFFKCCFTWFPWHFRRGRLRFDSRPDIIVKITQTIGGVDTVIYMDSYTNTRWNVSSTYLNLFLNDPAVRCGSGCVPQPPGSDVFFTLIGLDEVYKINQGSGKFSNLAFGGPYDNWAYGDWLLACALFGSALTNGSFYYRLSYRKGVNPFVPITTTLADTRVDKITLNSTIHTLGPTTVNGTPDLFEIRDMSNYYWYNPDKIGWWDTNATEPDSDLYTLRLEVFNNLGVHLTSISVNYLNGAVPPPGPLPPMVDHCDLNILVDNRYPTINLDVIGANGECGVVPCANRSSLTLNVFATQTHGRLFTWGLSYVKGLNAASGSLGGNTDYQGISPLPENLSLSGMAVAPLLSSPGTCAYSLTLSAWPLVRNGFGVIHYIQQTKAIAVEGC